MKIATNPDGSISVSEETGEGTGRQWDMHASELAAHLRGIDNKDHPFAGASKGDVSAMRDAANEFHKQRHS